MSLIISVSGLRGIVGETLTPLVAANYALAYSCETPEGPFVITRDGRASGVMLAEHIHAALNTAGRPTIDAGIAATPTTGILIRSLNAAGGLQISASHNPVEYNGIKLFNAEGRVIPKSHGEKVKNRYEKMTTDNDDHLSDNNDHLSKASVVAGKHVCPDTTSAHLEAVLQTINVAAIQSCQFRVLLDSNRGAGSILGRILLEKLGCHVTILGENPDGRFEHTPEPIEENLQSVMKKMNAQNFDVGFCQDPDADRLAVIDADGQFLGEEYTVAICVDHVLQNRGIGPLVINSSSSRMTQDIAEEYGATLYRSAVGEANVVDLMKEKSAIFGGEGNGGPIDPKVGFVRDSFVGMAQILETMALRKMTVASLADELPRYAIVKRKCSVPPSQQISMIPALKKYYEGVNIDVNIDLTDGFRVDGPKSWLQVRLSNTEPIARIIAEAPTEVEANKLCDEAEKVLADIG